MEKNIRVPELFGSQVFSEDVMRERLPKDVYKSLEKTIATGNEIDATIADVVASAMKDWAVEHGAALHALVPAPHGRNGGEARFLPFSRW